MLHLGPTMAWLCVLLYLLPVSQASDSTFASRFWSRASRDNADSQVQRHASNRQCPRAAKTPSNLAAGSLNRKNGCTQFYIAGRDDTCAEVAHTLYTCIGTILDLNPSLKRANARGTCRLQRGQAYCVAAGHCPSPPKPTTTRKPTATHKPTTHKPTTHKPTETQKPTQTQKPPKPTKTNTSTKTPKPTTRTTLRPTSRTTSTRKTTSQRPTTYPPLPSSSSRVSQSTRSSQSSRPASSSDTPGSSSLVSSSRASFSSSASNGASSSVSGSRSAVPGSSSSASSSGAGGGSSSSGGGSSSSGPSGSASSSVVDPSGSSSATPGSSSSAPSAGPGSSDAGPSSSSTLSSTSGPSGSASSSAIDPSGSPINCGVGLRFDRLLRICVCIDTSLINVGGVCQPPAQCGIGAVLNPVLNTCDCIRVGDILDTGGLTCSGAGSSSAGQSSSSVRSSSNSASRTVSSSANQPSASAVVCQTGLQFDNVLQVCVCIDTGLINIGGVCQPPAQCGIGAVLNPILNTCDCIRVGDILDTGGLTCSGAGSSSAGQSSSSVRSSSNSASGTASSSANQPSTSAVTCRAGLQFDNLLQVCVCIDTGLINVGGVCQPPAQCGIGAVLNPILNTCDCVRVGDILDTGGLTCSGSGSSSAGQSSSTVRSSSNSASRTVSSSANQPSASGVVCPTGLQFDTLLQACVCVDTTLINIGGVCRPAAQCGIGAVLSPLLTTCECIRVGDVLDAGGLTCSTPLSSTAQSSSASRTVTSSANQPSSSAGACGAGLQFDNLLQACVCIDTLLINVGGVCQPAAQCGVGAVLSPLLTTCECIRVGDILDVGGLTCSTPLSSTAQSSSASRTFTSSANQPSSSAVTCRAGLQFDNLLQVCVCIDTGLINVGGVCQPPAQCGIGAVLNPLLNTCDCIRVGDILDTGGLTCRNPLSSTAQSNSASRTITSSANQPSTSAVTCRAGLQFDNLLQVCVCIDTGLINVGGVCQPPAQCGIGAVLNPLLNTCDCIRVGDILDTGGLTCRTPVSSTAQPISASSTVTNSANPASSSAVTCRTGLRFDTLLQACVCIDTALINVGGVCQPPAQCGVGAVLNPILNTCDCIRVGDILDTGGLTCRTPISSTARPISASRTVTSSANQPSSSATTCRTGLEFSELLQACVCIDTALINVGGTCQPPTQCGIGAVLNPLLNTCNCLRVGDILVGNTCSAPAQCGDGAILNRTLNICICANPLQLLGADGNCRDIVGIDL